MNGQIRNFIQRNFFLVLNAVVGILLVFDLYIVYLQTRQSLYLDLLEGFLILEGMVLTIFFGIKLRHTSTREASLVENQERLNLFTQIMEECILIRDGETIVEVNDNLARLMGYEVNEMVGQNIFKFMDSFSGEKNKKWIALGYPSDRNELIAKRKDGTTFPLLIRGRDIVYKGRPMRLSCGWDITELRKMQETLETSEERFKAFADVTHEGILIHDKGVIVDVNQALADMVGMSTMDFLGKDSLFFLDEKSAKAVRDFRAGLVPSLPYQINLIHANGSLISSETYATNILWRGKEMRAVRIWNVTERKKTEKALLESQQRFERFAEVTREGILIHDKGLIVDVNQALSDIVGFSVEEIIGKRSDEFLSKESLKKIQEMRGKGYSTVPFEIAVKTKDGRSLPLEAHSSSFTMDGKELRVVRLWDITDRKKTEVELKESQERFKRFAEVGKEGIEIHDNGVIVDANQALADMLCIAAKDLIGKDLRDFASKEAVELMTQRMMAGYSSPYELTLRRKDGTHFPVELHGVNFNFGGKNLRVVRVWDITNRKKMEEALVESEERFKLFSEVSKEGIVIHENGIVVDVNQAGAEMIDYPLDMIVGKQVVDFLEADSGKRALRHLETGSFAKAEEMKLLRKGGTTIPIEVTGAGLSVKGKNLRISNFWDLTTRKQIEEALRKSEHSFRNLIEKSPDAILIHTREKTVYVNEAMLNLLGYENAEDIVGTVPTSFVHPDDVSAVSERIDQLKNPGDYNPPDEKRFIRKDGAILYVDVASFMIYFEGVPMTVAVARDLTERKKVQEALRQSEKNFRNLIERSPDGVFIHTLNIPPKIVYVNDSMLKFLDYSSVDELSALKPEEFIRSQDIPNIKERISRLKAQGDYNPPQEKSFIRRDGLIMPAEVVSFLIHYEGVPMAAVVARDLTERKKAEAALMKLERLSTIGEMAAGMAHEIRNPLAAISTAAQLLKRKKLKEDNGQLETILEQSERLEKLIRDTLDYAKPKVASALHVFSVRSAMESAVRLSQIQFGPSHQKVKVKWEVPPEDIQVKGDSVRIQQILVNLILNAFQIMGDKGELKLVLSMDKDAVFIRVEDNGPGITEENMKRIFEPFFTTKDHGSGLGLAISQRIAQEHGGQIKVERLKPKGTAFILRIPTNGEN